MSLLLANILRVVVESRFHAAFRSLAWVERIILVAGDSACATHHHIAGVPTPIHRCLRRDGPAAMPQVLLRSCLRHDMIIIWIHVTLLQRVIPPSGLMGRQIALYNAYFLGRRSSLVPCRWLLARWVIGVCVHARV